MASARYNLRSKRADEDGEPLAGPEVIQQPGELPSISNLALNSPANELEDNSSGETSSLSSISTNDTTMPGVFRDEPLGTKDSHKHTEEERSPTEILNNSVEINSNVATPPGDLRVYDASLPDEKNQSDVAEDDEDRAIVESVISGDDDRHRERASVLNPHRNAQAYEPRPDSRGEGSSKRQGKMVDPRCHD